MNAFAELLTQLETAVRAGDRAGALELARQIQQRLVLDQHEQAAVERRVRELLAELDHPATGARVDSFELLRGERGVRSVDRGADADTEGVVYPVWFGTNRKPNAVGTGFTGERHERVTRGRVEVYVPEAHRFGQTGTPFWKKLLRFDLRDDRLRVQRVETQQRDAFFAEIHAAMQDSGEAPHALLFLHGFVLRPGRGPAARHLRPDAARPGTRATPTRLARRGGWRELLETEEITKAVLG